MHTKFCSENMKGRDQLGDLGEEGREDRPFIKMTHKETECEYVD
jgi:hypothetical protein